MWKLPDRRDWLWGKLHLTLVGSELLVFCFLCFAFFFLLLGIKAITNRDSLLKSIDITLPTQVRLVKAVVSPVVMYGCESWTIKKAEH